MRIMQQKTIEKRVAAARRRMRSLGNNDVDSGVSPHTSQRINARDNA
jgi:hypothetical protein